MFLFVFYGDVSGVGMKRPASGPSGVIGFKTDEVLPAAHSFADLSVVRERGVQ
jgi:hypothetical protein